MDSTLAPIISSAIDYEPAHPALRPPVTEFPYPEPKRRRSSLERSENLSETTLYDSPDTVQSDTFLRPSVRDSQDQTEVPAPVTQRAFVPNDIHQSEGAHPRRRNESSDSSAWSSSDDDVQSLPKSRRREEHNPLSTTRLNQVRRHPPRPQPQKTHTDGRLKVGNEHFESKGKVAKDGRLNISVNETANSGYLAKALGATIHRHLHPRTKRAAEANRDQASKDKSGARKVPSVIPRLNIVIMVIGSRGDIQPFVKIGRILQDKYHHRVRIATHPTFKKFVEEEIGLEFFSIGGDPSELMAFMVKNPGLIPSFETIKAGEVGRRREQMYEMFQGFWRACINTTDNERDTANMNMTGDRGPFVADAIIANPPSFAHIHCAEKLNIPLHLVFTFPFSPTASFPHPLANIKTTNVDESYTNYMSYPLVDLMTWQGLGDLVNRFRVETLDLDPVSTLWAPGQLSRLKVPMTYLWSPGLVPKPADWGPEIDIAGYVFLELASSYKPPKELTKFLERSDGRSIIYIGFGSISGIDNPRAFCEMIFEAVRKTDVRAVVGRGWGGMGDGLDIPETVHLIDNVPHDWLFPQIDAVVHHGGAGTTAAGLKVGKPTMIVPFFGDQPFWSAMIVRAGAGAKQSLPLKKLDADKFAQGIRDCLEPEAKEKAQAIAKSIAAEGDGAQNAVDSFHSNLPLDDMRCGIFDERVAVWHVKHTHLQLSALAADLLVENKQLQWSDLTLIKHHAWADFQGPGEPITGAGGVLVAAFQEAFHELSSIPGMTKKDIQNMEKRKHKRRKQNVADNDGDQVDAALDFNANARDRPYVAGTTVDTVLASVPERPPNLRTSTSRTSSGKTMPTPVVVIKDVGKGLGKSTYAIVALPLEMFNALTLGLRNAPRLYGDRTVRPPPHPITGFRSGVRAAGKEFWYGFHDGVKGVGSLPYHATKDEGMVGLPKGIAQGVGGLVLKPVAGVLGLGAYTGKGVEASLRRRIKDTGRADRWIRRARMMQGTKELREVKEQGKLQHHQPDNDGTPNLEEVQTKVLTRWTTLDREALAQAREKDRTLLPMATKLRRATQVETA